MKVLVRVTSVNSFKLLAWFFILGGALLATHAVVAGTISDTETIDITATVSGGVTPPAPSGTTSGSSTLAKATFFGKAFPRAKLTVLKDGAIYTTLFAESNGSFSTTVSGLVNGNFLISIYALDEKGVESSPYVSNVIISNGSSVLINNILIPPTISVSNTAVQVGQTFVVYGYAPQNSLVTVEIPGQKTLASGTTDNNGLYQIPVDANVAKGLLQLRTKASLGGFVSNYSKPVSVIIFGKGEALPPPPKQAATCVDYNQDRKVNLVDFSILLFWFGKDAPPESIDCNNDQTIDIKDFSILMYFWTG